MNGYRDYIIDYLLDVIEEHDMELASEVMEWIADNYPQYLDIEEDDE